MALDFNDFFKRYEAILKTVDATFEQIQAQTGDMVHCGRGCSDCCYALFDISLVEALYLNHHFQRLFSGPEKNALMERADKADREVNRLKRKLFKASEEGTPSSELLRQVAEARLRCPLLGEDDLCALYDYRPVTCRTYGVPTAIGGEVHTCGRSGFEPGQPYPTIHVEKLQDALMALSQELAQSINSRYVELGSLLIPPSMAIITDMNEDYLGVMQPAQSPAQQPTGNPLPMNCSSCGEGPGSSACSSCKDDSFSITIGGPDRDDD
ncbi:MAG: YkgJ family cysteine cluster protein [Desulfovibrionaceae bacterium]